MNTDHTPGPWQCKTHRDRRSGGRVVMAAGLDPIAIAHDGGERADADAALIAASPDLLRVCRSILTRWESEAPGTVFPAAARRDDLRAAVAKAEGRDL